MGQQAATTGKPIVHGIFDANTSTVTYVVYDKPGSSCAIIDPVLDYDPKSGRTSHASADKVVAFVRAQNLTVQWILETHEYFEWKKHRNEERFVPLHKLLTSAHQRYHRPFVITETSHPREDRPLWVEMIIEECALMLMAGLPLWGVCWYPIIDRPDWDHLNDWHQSGIWDELLVPTDSPTRNLHLPTAQTLINGQIYLEETFGVK